MSRSLKTVKSNPLAGRIKKVMQTDEDVGKIAQGTPILLARATELFLSKLCEGTASAATSCQARTATPIHLKAYIQSNSKMDFLADKIANIPDFSEEDHAPVKRQRSDKELASSPSGLQLSPGSPGNGKPARGRGRGRSRGRGSVRISADHSQLAQPKHDSSELHTSPSSALAPDSSTQAQGIVKAEHDAADAAVQKADSDSQAQAAHEVSALKQEDVEQVSAVPDPSLQQDRSFPVQESSANVQHVVVKLPTEQSAVLAEEDDYDAED